MNLDLAPSVPPEYVEALLVEKALRLRAAHANRAARVTAGERLEKLKASLFPQQRAFVDDTCITKDALCTRRAGKSYGADTALIVDASDEEVGFDTCYVNITLKEAKRIAWNGPSGLKSLNRQFDLGMKFNNADLVATTTAGHSIVMAGAETEDDIEKLRGQPFKLVIIDEAQSYRPHIDALIQQVLFPALMDYGGRIALVGTPGPVLAGLFYEVTSGKLPGWSNHRWHVRDNPHMPKVKTPEIPDVDTFLRIVRERFGWTEETPAYQREYEGRWVREDSTLVYLYGPKNIVKGLPGQAHYHWRFGIGLDLGYSNAETTGFEVGAWCAERPEAVLVEGFKRGKMSLDDVAAELWRLIRKYRALSHDAQVFIVADPGGLGAQIVDELATRHRLPIIKAEKSEKQAYIKAMNADLATGRLLVIEGNPILGEWDALQWTLRRDLKDLREEDPRFPNHLSDAGLYVWRHMLHFLHRPKETGPAPGTEEYHRAMAQRMEQEDDDDARSEQRKGWWDRDIQ